MTSNEEDLKTCFRCKNMLPLQDFPRDPGRAGGLYPYCKPCKSAYMRAYARSKPHYHRRKEALRRYGLQWSDYQRMLADQGNACAICREEKPLGVDHDHETGEVRALLCMTCNMGLGSFKDSTELLAAAIKYLERFQS